MVFKDQCKLPATSSGSSRHGPPLREELVADFSSGKKEKWNSGYLLLLNRFFCRPSRW